MQSPLEVSHISLSQSTSSNYSQFTGLQGSRIFDVESPTTMSTNKDFLYQRPLAPNAVPLLVRLQRLRILLTAVLGAALIGILMAFLQAGLVLESHIASKEGSVTLDVYNFILGLVTSVFVKPLLALITAVVPAVLLCFFTQVTMQDTSSKWTRWALAFVGNLVLYLLLNGFMALYVSEKRVQFDQRITDNDVASYETSMTTTWNASSSFHTILRNAMELADATAENAQGQCQKPSPRRLPAQINYGFPSRPWLRELLPFAPETNAFNTLSMPLKTPRLESLQDVQIPMTFTAAQQLMSYVFRATDDFFRPQDTSTNASLFQLVDEFKSSNEATVNNDTETMQSLLEAISGTLNRAVTTRPFMKNVSVAESRVEFVRYPWTTDSGGIVFEGVTLELPMTHEYLRRKVQVKQDTTEFVDYGPRVLDGLFEINAKEECGRHGCVVSPVGAALTTASVDEGSQVRALPICLNRDGHEDFRATMNGTDCRVRSRTSMLVVSFAKRIVGDAMSSSIRKDVHTEASIVMLTNARQIHQVTVGRLVWDIADLADTYEATCEAEDCHGLVFPLDDSTRQVIVGQFHVPIANLTSYSPSVRLWTPLITSNAQEVDRSDILKSDFVFPRNFKDTSGWTGVDGSHCERERGAFMDHVERSHLYSESSLQPAYMSALFWVFQHGVVKHKLSATTLAFDASVEFVEVTLSVPRASAILTFVGCALLLLMALLVYFGGKSREAAIERHFKPHHLARILLDDEEFSHRLLKCDLLNIGNKYLNSSELLDQFEISGLALRHRERPSDVLIVPKDQRSTVGTNHVV
ncbi:hypothetical protein CCR75_009700 [Bremia lactucae]|uniref:Uncharacterized protein n=1 Tax=Bremia lactucae TaxID=4779 RepID=A0A976FL57_BRELC|nr:hypothetical protein CCR75_009700 [Bremia lactucae]